MSSNVPLSPSLIHKINPIPPPIPITSLTPTESQPLRHTLDPSLGNYLGKPAALEQPQLCSDTPRVLAQYLDVSCRLCRRDEHGNATCDHESEDIF